MLRDVSLALSPGRFHVLLGKSGSGKTTLIRIIAGLDRSDSGSITEDGCDLSSLSPQKRSIGLVFQDGGLYPHLSGRRNLEYGIPRKVSRIDAAERIDRILTVLDLEQHAHKRPEQLSGGERQRFALGKILIRRPRLALFDEPLSNVDVYKRSELRSLLKAWQQEWDVTALLVTHDQNEAAYLADEISVLGDGIIQQSGSPEQLLTAPRNLFVARFVGSPPVNVSEALLLDDSSTAHVECFGARHELEESMLRALRKRLRSDRRFIIGIRPHNLLIGAARKDAVIRLSGVVRHSWPLPPVTVMQVDAGNYSLYVASAQPISDLLNSRIDLHFNLEDAEFFRFPEGGKWNDENGSIAAASYRDT